MALNFPENMTLCGASEPLEIQAAEGDGAKTPKFTMVAYTGDSMDVGYGGPVVVDIGGVKASQTLPILYQHDAERIVGHTTSVDLSQQRIKIAGVVSGTADGPAAQVIATAKNGFPWQASIGLKIHKAEYVEAGQTVKVNGRNFTGPITVIRSGTLRESSFVAMGADGKTSATIAASLKGTAMEEDKKTETVVETVSSKVDAAAEIADLRAKFAAEAKRVNDINAACVGHADISAKAIAEGWTAEKAESEVLKAELKKLRESRPNVPAGHVKATDLSASVLECAMLQHGRHPNVEKMFDDKTLQAAHTQFKGRIGLKQVLVAYAMQNGYTGSPYLQSDGDIRDCLKAAFSTVGLSGTLSNTANKFLIAGYMGVENGWERIASKRSVSDFKAVTTYRLTGAHQLTELPASGLIEHSTVDELSYTNQAKTYANMIALTRTTIINDDLGALSAIPMKLGRGAALKRNDLVWSAFMDNSTFFSSGNNNYFTGSATTLQSSSLATAEQKFLKQTDADGKPLGYLPAVLLVPPEVKRTAMELMSSSTFYGGTTTIAQNPSANTWQGAYEVVTSSYLSNTSYTGYSTTAWYLLANPSDASTIEVCFLNGVEVPTIETADADFNTLGIQMRAYMDMGVTKQDFRGGVKSKGAA